MPDDLTPDLEQLDALVNRHDRGNQTARNRRQTKTGTHHLDRVAGRLIEYGAAAGAPDDLLSTKELAGWLGYSVQWLEIKRHKGDGGPSFVRPGGRVRYRRSDVIEWLESRRYACTSEYRARPAATPSSSAGNGAEPTTQASHEGTRWVSPEFPPTTGGNGTDPALSGNVSGKRFTRGAP